MENLTLPAVFLAGLISFLTPCVLPLVPAYLSYLAGNTLDEITHAEARPHVLRRLVLTAVVFVLGFSTVFVTLGATASVFGALVRQHLDVLTVVAGLAIILMGLHFLGVFRVALFYREARLQVEKPVGLTGAYVMGLAFGFGWTPCIGPVLAAVLAVAAVETTALQGAGLLAVYALGLGVPFVLAALAMRPFMSFSARVRRYLSMVEKIMGTLLVLVGLAFLFGWLTQLSFWLLEMFPALGRLG